MPESQAINAIIILGMHRCGTSSLGGALNIVGADFGPHPIAKAPDNPMGFWEHPGIVALHEKFLAAAGSAWDDASPFADGWKEGEAAAFVRSHLKEILQRDFGTSPLWFVKDPRLCRLLPLWKPVLAELGIRPGFVIISRNPVEVAASLHQRNGIAESKSHLLWLQHMLAAEHASRGSRRSFLTYAEFLSDPLAALNKIAFELRIAWPTRPEFARKELTGFLNPGLWHHHVAGEPAGEPSPLRDLAMECARVLQRGGACAGAKFEKSLDGIASALGDGSALLRSEHLLAALNEKLAALSFVVAERTELERILRARDEGIYYLQLEVSARSIRIAALEKTLRQMEASPYWHLRHLVRHPRKALKNFLLREKRAGFDEAGPPP
jgi:hypothetical protein